MTTFYKDMENAISKNGERGLAHIMYYYGMELDTFRDKTDDVYTRVHGRDSGNEGAFHKQIIGIVEGAEFSASNKYFSSDHIAGKLYTEEADLKAGDVIKLPSDDGKSRRFKLTEKLNIGFTTEIFSMWSLASIGD